MAGCFYGQLYTQLSYKSDEMSWQPGVPHREGHRPFCVSSSDLGGVWQLATLLTNFQNASRCIYYCSDRLQRFFESTGLSAIQCNARSLEKHYDDICIYLASTEYPFPFICMPETWLSSDDSNLFCLPHYPAEYCHRESNSHGGAAIFISSSIK